MIWWFNEKTPRVRTPKPEGCAWKLTWSWIVPTWMIAPSGNQTAYFEVIWLFTNKKNYSLRRPLGVSRPVLYTYLFPQSPILSQEK